jgi:ssDNA-binding Zn-finger/Zn-ribbon topoisomerase 1
MKMVEVEVVGLKCDNPTCGHIIKDIPESRYESYIGRPCPSCGDMILSQQEFDDYERMKRAGRKANAILNVVKWTSASTYLDLLRGKKV